MYINTIQNGLDLVLLTILTSVLIIIFLMKNVCVWGGDIQIYREGVIHFWLVRDIQIGGIIHWGFYLVNNNDEETWYEQSEYSIS